MNVGMGISLREPEDAVRLELMHLVFFPWAVPSCFRRGAVLSYVAFSLFWLLLAPAAMAATVTSGPTIILAFSEESMPPYVAVDPQAGTISGPWREMLDEVFERRLGWHVKYLIRPWLRAQNEVKLGQADGMITIATEERLGFTVTGETPFCCFPLHLFTWQGHPRFDEMRRIDSVAGLRDLGLTLVSNIGNGWYKDTIEHAGVATIWLPTDEQMVRFVAVQRADGFIDLPGSIAHLAGNLGLHDRIIDTGVSFGKVDIHLLIGRDSPFADRIGEIDAALQACRAEGCCLGSRFAAGDSQNTPGGGRLCDCGLVR